MNGNGHDEKPKRKSRLDNIEAAQRLMIKDHEDFRREHKNLLRAQVLLQDAQKDSEKKIRELAVAQAKSEKRMDTIVAELRELSQKTDERIAAMTSAIGELVRRWPLPPQAGA